MSSTSGWVEYEGETIKFPFIPSHQVVWNMAILDWCKLNNIAYFYKDPFWVYAQVTKNEIQDFINVVYVFSAPQDMHEKAKKRLVDLELLRSRIVELPEEGKFILSGYDY